MCIQGYLWLIPVRTISKVFRHQLYGLKSSRAEFRALLAEQLDTMRFKLSIADPDVWLSPGVKPDGEEYYKYILVYVDDILFISHKPKETR